MKALAIILCLIVSGCASFQGNTAARSEKVSGSIRDVDYEKKLITFLTKEKAYLVFELSAETRIRLMTGQMAELKDLLRGQDASVIYQHSGAKLIAETVLLESRPGGCPEGRPCPPKK